MTTFWKNTVVPLLWLLAAMLIFGMAVGVKAHADPLPPNCVQQYWLFGGLFGRGTTRTICDKPIEADGSWMRGRLFYDGERYVPMRCSWGSYGGSCSGGYWLEEFSVFDSYRVTPDSILPDEPGHLG